MPVDKVKKRLEQVIDQAKLRIDLDSAQNPELRRAIHIVEVFLQKSGRVCYGGQAINAQLPQKVQFYDPDRALPDYDFFSPDAEGDTAALIETLKTAGYNEISKRIGIHDGTIKLYVNYSAIADISQMIPEFYDVIYKNSSVVNGIHYADPIFLRMLMFLELSRPRGQVERWDKVFDRLKLLDEAHPIPKCKRGQPMIQESKEAEVARPHIIRYMIKHNRVFMGADIFSIYSASGKGRSTKSRADFLLHGKAPAVFFSPNAEEDANELSQMTMSVKEDILGFQNILPAMIVLFKNESVVCVIVQEEACHSTVTIPLTKGRYLRIASLDTLLTFLIGLYYRPDSLLMTQESLLCWIRNYIDLSNRYKSKPTKLFPAFSLECSGYQTSFASLLRAKAARIQAERQRLSSGHKASSMTRDKRFVNYGSRRTRRKNNMIY
uniref:Poly(A) polymerase catalytic subunit domain-containing protein n=1 Tax=viral metagenome TaxID=1070528 RepID=A0A6C0APM4_9ZZZZ